MATLVISDLHLGARSGVDVLRGEVGLGALLAGLDGVERLVLLGDVLELRHGPPRDAMDAARPVLRAIGEAMGADGEVVLVPGNHDARITAPWLDWRGRRGHAPLGLEERAGPKATIATRAIARMVQPATLEVAYPGIWLDDDIYATHGHYLDRHTTLPTLERLAIGVIGRVLRASVPPDATPDDYELVLAPLYALLDALAAHALDGRAAESSGASTRAWQALSTSSHGGFTMRALASAFPVAIAALNRLGIGPLRAQLSGEELRRSSLLAMREVVARLHLEAAHVVFGHTHRGGPLPGDDLAEWALPGGGRLHNAGCWVFESAYVDGDGPSSPYWPGGAIRIERGAEPRHVRLLEGVDAARLRLRTPAVVAVGGADTDDAVGADADDAVAADTDDAIGPGADHAVGADGAPGARADGAGIDGATPAGLDD